MRTLFSGEFPVAYGQFHIDGRADPDEGPEAGLSECFMGQRAGLCGAAVPGHLLLLTGMHTGSVPLTVELRETEPPLDLDAWEDVVEVSFRTAPGGTELLGWDGDGWDLGLPPDTYRVRYHCRGMDQAHDSVRSEGEPVLDAYLLLLWPAPPHRDRVVKGASESAAYWHRFARKQPPAPTPEEAAEAERRAREKQEAEAREVRERAERAQWGGRVPSDRLRHVGGNVAGIVDLDAALVHAVDEAGPDVQRAVARWAAHRACDVAGLSGVDWIARALGELDRGVPLSPPFGDEERTWDLLSSDPQVPDTVIATPSGTPNASQQAMALPALTDAAGHDPLRAALDALYAAAVAHGPGWRELLGEVRSAFPDTSHAPPPSGHRPPRHMAATLVARVERRRDGHAENPDEPRER